MDGVSSFAVGGLTVHQISDGSTVGARRSWFHGIDPAEWVPATGRSGADAPFQVNFGFFAVVGDGTVTLVDTGLGATAYTRPELSGASLAVRHLAALGITADAVDRIVQTHLHHDHCGWLIDLEENLTFPRAEVLVHADELAFWESEASRENPFNGEMVPFVRQRVAAVRGAGRLRVFTGTETVGGGLTALPTPGHTPGHTTVLVESDGDTAILLGDVAHLPLHLERHGWLPAIDVDPAASIRSRELVARLAVARDAVLVAPHFNTGIRGRLAADGDGYRYQPV